MALNNGTITTQQFNIPLKQNSTRGIDITSILMVLLSLLAFLYIAVSQNHTIIIACLGVLVILAFWQLYLVYNGRPAFKYLYFVLLLVAVYWFFQGGTGILIGLLLVVAAFLETRVKQKPAILITGEGVTIPGIIPQTYNWQQLANVIVKDGLVTIDTKSNKFLQKVAEDDITAEYEHEINEFCRSQLLANS